MTLEVLNTAVLATVPLQAEGGGGGGLLAQAPLILLFLGVFYFIVWRPQSKARKEHEQLITTLKKGDEVVTEGGIVGKIAAVEDHIVVLEVSDKNRMRVKKESISGKFGEPAEEDSK